MEKLHLEHLFPILPAKDDISHVVVEDFSGNALQKMEGVDMAVQEGFQGTALYKLDVHGPGIA